MTHPLVVAIAAAAFVAGCASPDTGSTPPATPATVPASSASMSSAPASSGAGRTTTVAAPPVTAPGSPADTLPAEDPDHSTAQPFPAAGSCHARTVTHGTLPDPTCTPGAIDPHVTDATLDTTICRAGGYTSTVRPPESVTRVEKRSALTAYGITAPASSTELDHLVSLELGGSPNSPRNLWPEPGASPNPKDKLESALHDLVCTHRMSLTDAQHAIATDWVALYRQVLGVDPPPVP